MDDCISVRAVKVGQYIVENSCTVRAAAAVFGIGKSTVYKDVTEHLGNTNPALAASVRKVLDYNLSVRHIRGGEATRNKRKSQADNA